MDHLGTTESNYKVLIIRRGKIVHRSTFDRSCKKINIGDVIFLGCAEFFDVVDEQEIVEKVGVICGPESIAQVTIQFEIHGLSPFAQI